MGNSLINYPFIAIIFTICVAHWYLAWTNYLQSKEADRLGVPNVQMFKWRRIDVDHPNCSEELRRAYKKTNRLFWLNFAAIISIPLLSEWLT